MKNGFIKVCAATPKVSVAGVHQNIAAIKELIDAAAAENCSLLVLPELCVTAYTCGDLFLSDALLSSALDATLELSDYTRGKSMLTIFGAPVSVGGKLYNCAAVCFDGKLLALVPKTNIPNYGEFYELRHFTPAPAENREIELRGHKLMFGTKLIFRDSNLPDFAVAAEICEDLWVSCPPSVSHASAGAAIICNLSASDETVGKEDYRRSLVSVQSARLLCGYIYSDAGDGESTTDMVFAGHSLICENGAVLAESKPFMDTGKLLTTELDVSRLAYERRRMNTFTASSDGYLELPFDLPLTETVLTRVFPQTPFVPSALDDRRKRCESILTMQSRGLAKRMEAAHSNGLVVGISGGLDSCLALLVSAKAADYMKRPRTDITAVTMPCFGTTERTRGNAELLCEYLGVTFRCIDIKEAVDLHFRDIGHDPNERNVVYENVQARERTQVIMDIANGSNSLVVGTGDLSELALGWATYNGDHMSMYGVNASVPKTLVRHIVRYCAEAYEDSDSRLSAVLLDILDTPVSPELLPADSSGDIAQKTEDIVGPYELHDFFLYYMLRFGFTPDKLERIANHAFAGTYSPLIISKWLDTFTRRFFIQQFKRSCLPDGPKVGSVTLSPRSDWRMPSDAVSEVWRDEYAAFGKAWRNI